MSEDLYRAHHAYHERRLEQQMLDTLLRIEEILKPSKPVVEAVEEAKPTLKINRRK